MVPQIALCSKCGCPLVSAYFFPGSEFYCVDCGQKYGLFGNYEEVDLTAELKARYQENERWFCKVAGDILTGVRLRNCEKCGHEPHLWHCTEGEREKHNKAMGLLQERIDKGKHNGS